MPTLSGSPSSNFWYKLFSIITSPFFNMMFFLSIGANVIYVSSELSKSYNIISRYSNYDKLIKSFIHDIIITTVILCVVSIILAIAGAIVFSYGDFSMFVHPYYDIPIAIYIPLFLLRSWILACLINVIIYFLFIIFKKMASTFIILILSSFFLIMPSCMTEISHFYNMKLMYHYYFSMVHYSSLFLEMTCSFIQFIILFAIYKLLYRFVALKKRDLL